MASLTQASQVAPAAPRAMAWAVAALLVLALAAVGVQRQLAPAAPAAPAGTPIAVLAYTFHDRADGGIEARRAADGVLVHTVPAQSNGFLRGTLRGLARERKRRGLGPALPVQLLAYADGRLLLQDPATGWQTDLQAFGPTNTAAFVPLLRPQ